MATSSAASLPVALLGLAATALPAEAETTRMAWIGAGWFSWTLTFLLVVVAIVAVGWLITETIEAWKMRQSIEVVEDNVASILGRSRVSLAELPDILRGVNEDVAAVLADVGENAAAGAPAKPGAPPGEQDPLSAAIALLSVTVQRIKQAPASSPIHKLELELRLSHELQATLVALKGISAQPEASRTLADLLRAGQLNHVLTMAPLLGVYFAEEDAVATLRTAYQAAAALIELALADGRIAVVVVPPLSTVVRGASRGIGFEDQRGLRRIPGIRDKVVRAARETPDGDQLIVDCLAPGWRAGTERQRPQIVGFSRADWN